MKKYKPVFYWTYYKCTRWRGQVVLVGVRLGKRSFDFEIGETFINVLTKIAYPFGFNF